MTRFLIRTVIEDLAELTDVAIAPSIRQPEAFDVRVWQFAFEELAKAVNLRNLEIVNFRMGTEDAHADAHRFWTLAEPFFRVFAEKTGRPSAGVRVLIYRRHAEGPRHIAEFLDEIVRLSMGRPHAAATGTTSEDAWTERRYQVSQL